jgi:hypothetical protein
LLEKVLCTAFAQAMLLASAKIVAGCQRSACTDEEKWTFASLRAQPQPCAFALSLNDYPIRVA